MQIQDNTDVLMQTGDESEGPAEASTHPGKKFFPKKFAGVGKKKFFFCETPFCWRACQGNYGHR